MRQSSPLEAESRSAGQEIHCVLKAKHALSFKILNISLRFILILPLTLGPDLSCNLARSNPSAISCICLACYASYPPSALIYLLLRWLHVLHYEIRLFCSKLPLRSLLSAPVFFRAPCFFIYRVYHDHAFI